jgi:hypothetical protein
MHDLTTSLSTGTNINNNNNNNNNNNSTNHVISFNVGILPRPPVVKSMVPSTGSVTQGAIVTVTAAFLATVSSENELICEFGGVLARVTKLVYSDNWGTRFVVIVPGLAAGPVQVCLCF